MKSSLPALAMRAQRPVTRETPPEQVDRASPQGLLPGIQTSGLKAPREKGCEGSEGMSALPLQAPDPTPIPDFRDPLLWPGTLCVLTEELVCHSTSKGDGNGLSYRLSGEGEVHDRHTPSGNPQAT